MAIPGIDDNDLNRLSNLSSNFNNVANATNNYQQNIIGLNKDLEEFNDLTSQLNQSLKNQVANVKDSKSPWQNYYDLVQKAKIAQKELNEGTEKYNDLISKVQQSAQVESIIKDGINSRRKLGKTKLVQ
jgi:methyl-accepting chemotaxis protein